MARAIVRTSSVRCAKRSWRSGYTIVARDMHDFTRDIEDLIFTPLRCIRKHRRQGALRGYKPLST